MDTPVVTSNMSLDNFGRDLIDLVFCFIKKVAQGAKIRGASQIIGVDINPEKVDIGTSFFFGNCEILFNYKDCVNKGRAFFSQLKLLGLLILLTQANAMNLFIRYYYSFYNPATSKVCLSLSHLSMLVPLPLEVRYSNAYRSHILLYLSVCMFMCYLHHLIRLQHS